MKQLKLIPINWKAFLQNPKNSQGHSSISDGQKSLLTRMSAALAGLGQMVQKCLCKFVMAFALASCSLITINVQAADEVVTFENPAHKEMYQILLKEYRCLKCQNQNLWDSNAGLAGDLRREIRGQIIAGNTKADIDEYLVSRYGEFVLYRPRFSSKTAILWIGPFVLLLIGLMSLVFMVRSKSKSTSGESPEERAAAALALHSEDQLAKARDFLKD